MQTRGIRILTLAGCACALSLFAGLAGCGKSDETASLSPSADKAALSLPTSDSPTAGANAIGKMGAAPLHVAARQPGAERSVMREASLAVDVDNLDKAEKQTRQSVSSHGGY